MTTTMKVLIAGVLIGGVSIGAIMIPNDQNGATHGTFDLSETSCAQWFDMPADAQAHAMEGAVAEYEQRVGGPHRHEARRLPVPR